MTQSPNHKGAGIWVSNRDSESHFCSGCVEQSQNLFWNSLKIKSPQQANSGKLSRNTVVIPPILPLIDLSRRTRGLMVWKDRNTIVVPPNVGGTQCKVTYWEVPHGSWRSGGPSCGYERAGLLTQGHQMTVIAWNRGAVEKIIGQ